MRSQQAAVLQAKVGILQKRLAQTVVEYKRELEKMKELDDAIYAAMQVLHRQEAAEALEALKTAMHALLPKFQKVMNTQYFVHGTHQWRESFTTIRNMGFDGLSSALEVDKLAVEEMKARIKLKI